jgi:hypothetical protein
MRSNVVGVGAHLPDRDQFIVQRTGRIANREWKKRLLSWLAIAKAARRCLDKCSLTWSAFQSESAPPNPFPGSDPAECIGTAGDVRATG